MFPVPQSNTPLGYCPVKTWPCPARSSKVTMTLPGAALGTTVGTLVGAAVVLGLGVGIWLGAGV